MKVLFSWLKELVEIDITPDELAERLSLSGTAVESLTYLGEEIKNVYSARIEKIFLHPNADNLSLCEVNAGAKGKTQVVCGASNIKEGDVVPLALVPAILPGGIKVERRNIRGITSDGMLVSPAELGVSEDNTGIMILPSGTEVGIDIRKALGLDDYLFEFEIMPNRSDCLGVIGIAREIAALLGRNLKLPPAEDRGIEELASDRVKVEILSPNLCPRYTARLLKEVEVKPSPYWLQFRLKAAGIRPINNVVDVTNYVMLETGQPLHAFDFRYIGGAKIIVRQAKEGEKIVALDGREYALDSETLVIADAEEPVAIAGVMGGESSEVTENTTEVLLESAHFSPVSIAKTSRRLSLSSEASYRFERGVSIEGTVYAANRAAYLLAELASAKVFQEVVDAYPLPYERKTIVFRPARASLVLGKGISAAEMKRVFVSLGLEVKAERESKFEVVIPAFRPDLEREIDLIEEVARFHGYNEIPSTLPKLCGGRGLNHYQAWQRQLRELLVGAGLMEVMNFSFFNPELSSKLLGYGIFSGVELVEIANPILITESTLRPSLIFGLLETVKRNLSRNNENLSFFEIGKVFFRKHGERKEEERLGISLCGGWQEKDWSTDFLPFNFYDLKGIIELILEANRIDNWQYKNSTYSFLHPYRQAEVYAGERLLGFLGELSSGLKEELDLNSSVWLSELDICAIFEARQTPFFKEVPRFPPALFDLSFLVDKEILVAELLKTIKRSANYLKKVVIFDVYEGENLPVGKKSIAFRLFFQSSSKTLSAEEVEEEVEKIVRELSSKFNATLREARS